MPRKLPGEGILNDNGVLDRVLDAAQVIFDGPVLTPQGNYDKQGRLVPPESYSPDQTTIRDPFLANWDPLRRSGRIVNPSSEQRRVALTEAIGEGVAAVRGSLPGQLAQSQFNMARRAIGGLQGRVEDPSVTAQRNYGAGIEARIRRNTAKSARRFK